MINARLGAKIVTMLLAAALASACDREADDLRDLPPLRTNVNILVNPGFEEWDGLEPVGWELKHISGEGERVNFHGRSNESAAGNHSYFLRGVYNTDRWMVLTQTHPVYPGHDIIFSADIKTDRIKAGKGQERNANIYVRFLDAHGKRLSDRGYADARTGFRTGTSDWQRDTRKVEVPKRARFVEIGLINRMTGYAYFDNVELVIQKQIEWQEKKTAFINFRWQPERPFPPEEMKRQAEMIDAMAKKIGLKKGAVTITYYLYPDEAAFMRILDRKRYSRAVRWDRKEMHSIETYDEHDIIYLLLYDLGKPPLGVVHGLGYYLRSQYKGWDPYLRAKGFLIERQLPGLYQTIAPVDFMALDSSVIVPAWSSFVAFLVDRYGMQKLLRLYRETDGVEVEAQFSTRFREIYGAEFQVLDRDWRLFLMRYQGAGAAGG